MQKTVICFDRDQTVDVNPPQDKTLVPLSWLEFFAHECDTTDVWAIGNKQLQIEAALPTPYEAKEIRKNSNYSVNKSLSSRRDGLDIIKILYDKTPTDNALIVVDDEDLSQYAKSSDFYRMNRGSSIMT